MVRKLFSGICIQLISICAYCQSATIKEEPLDISTNVYQYTANFFFPFSPGQTAPVINWSVQNGTINSQNTNPALGPITAVVEWWSTPATITITATDHRGLIQTTTHTHNFNFSGCWITPTAQSLFYSQVPLVIAAKETCIDDGKGGTNTFQWQELNVDVWDDISGETGMNLQLAAINSHKYRVYRRKTMLATDIVYTGSSSVSLATFSPGTIYSSNLTPELYSTASITATYAGGGLCDPTTLQYTWEQSVDFGVWTSVGTTKYAPIINIRGKTRVRRKVLDCDGNAQYSNILEFNPTYTSLNFENLNYVRELTILSKSIFNWEDADYQPIGNKLQNTVYLDGFGRPIQSVSKEANPVPGAPTAWLDLVKHFEYDAAGRSSKDFIPYPTSEYLGKFKPNASTTQSSVYNFFDNETISSPTYSKVNFDESPLNKVIKSMAPGASWGGNNIGESVSENFNDASENIPIWTLGYTSTALPVATQVYASGKLIKLDFVDENQKRVITYTDFSGNIILKKVQEKNVGSELTDQHAGWACTYYVYDDFGLLRYILSPKAVRYLDENSWPTITQTLIDELCFKYLYDKRGRTIIKKDPSVGEEKFIYDNKDRLVLTQHANQEVAYNPTLSNNQWAFTLYDELNRQVATGLLSNNETRASLQDEVSLLSNSSVTISAFVGSGYESINANIPVAGSTSSANYLMGNSEIIFNSVTHYDNYNYAGLKTYNPNFAFAYTPGPFNTVEATIKSDRTNNLVTGEKVRVLDTDNNLFNDKFLFSTAYYNEEELSIQNLVDNIKDGVDYQVHQYDFGGKLMSTYTSHNDGGSLTHSIISKQEYDKIGRLIKISKKFNNTFYKVLVEYIYDELGRVKTKKIAPGYTGIPGKSEMESISYNYNIRGWITGINKDYALSTNNYSQWDKFFGVHFTYADHSSPQLNGNISSIVWKSQGDNSPRKYDLEYDNLDRFKTAFFNQKNKPNSSWSNSEVDFSTYVEYEDVNGNIKSMKHMGIIPGMNSGVLVDDLRYAYLTTGISNLNGNRLKQVEDQGTLASQNNGLLGDFKDGNTTQDYYYDVNGNLVKDLNKNIKNSSANGITYNYMNKPEKVIIEGKSNIEFTYDASGEKLKKKVTYNDGSIRINHYVGDFIYEQFIPVGGGGDGDVLQCIILEEGRLKIIIPHTAVNGIDYELNAGSSGITNWPGSKQAVFEYLIKDHLGNTRMVLTEEVQKEFYTATVESTTSISQVEEPIFGRVNSDGSIPTNNELKKTRFDNTGSSPWPNKTDDFTKLTAAQTDMDKGPNVILKVMAGDNINANVDYYYFANNSAGPTYDPVAGLLTSFGGALLDGKANLLGKNQQSTINTTLNNDIPLADFLSGHNDAASSPKAFLNIVFFDEQFKFIARDLVTPGIGSGFVRVSSADNPNASMGLEKKAPKNGWVFIYLSNESNEAVYFDNFYISHEHGRISEENHYYPFGLKIGGISSKAFNKLQNKYKFQGSYAEVEEETGWDEFFFRNYDAQIGRWTSTDPFGEFPNPYTGMGNNPIKNIDPTGGIIIDLPRLPINLLRVGTFAFDVTRIALSVVSAANSNNYSNLGVNAQPYDWIKRISTGRYEWRSNVTSMGNTPKNFRYIGPNDNDILRDLGWNAEYKDLRAKVTGYIAGDMEEGKGSTNFIVTARVKTSILIRANVEYGKNNTRKFLGVSVSFTNVASNTGPIVLHPTGTATLNFGNKTYSTNLAPPTARDRLWATGTTVTVGGIMIPASELPRGVTGDGRQGYSDIRPFPGATVRGNWWHQKEDGSMTPLIGHPLFNPTIRKYTHKFLP